MVSRWCRDKDNAQTLAAAGRGVADRFFLIFSILTNLKWAKTAWVGPWRWTPDDLRANASLSDPSDRAGTLDPRRLSRLGKHGDEQIAPPHKNSALGRE
jgi:hypothetical protein